jgi:hypothetical protein
LIQAEHLAPIMSFLEFEDSQGGRPSNIMALAGTCQHFARIYDLKFAIQHCAMASDGKGPHEDTYIDCFNWLFQEHGIEISRSLKERQCIPSANVLYSAMCATRNHESFHLLVDILCRGSQQGVWDTWEIYQNTLQYIDDWGHVRELRRVLLCILHVGAFSFPDFVDSEYELVVTVVVNHNDADSMRDLVSLDDFGYRFTVRDLDNAIRAGSHSVGAVLQNHPNIKPQLSMCGKCNKTIGYAMCDIRGCKRNSRYCRECFSKQRYLYTETGYFECVSTGRGIVGTNIVIIISSHDIYPVSLSQWDCSEDRERHANNLWRRRRALEGETQK